MAETAPLVDVTIEDIRWSALDIDALATNACAATLDHLGLGLEWEIALLACDDARIAVLNQDFRQKSAPTNVLSWPSEERGADIAGTAPRAPDPSDPELGDIAIAYDTCAAEARAADVPLADHATHLIVHGLLHLLGYDHERDADGDLMERCETQILAQMGLSDPYARQPTHLER
ncbi:rRNA maturation RNase YbeY [Maribius pontilimi]|uniref:Endoribonuclease YbeY n=1 Tax=Palleronia pontilimi TaxID=1964209 RepID=A0A934IGW0_9RHOB|nr:rRNA maturation RNase YbeY [Palleronia pontilimi]MBJ3762350.1 rRNA maturation RNase YbeY [Palleronia pontilimi]